MRILQRLALIIKYRAGKQNTNADALSRLNGKKPEECVVDQVEAALATSLNNTAVPKSVREQLLQLAEFLAKNPSAVVEQLTVDSPFSCTVPVQCLPGTVNSWLSCRMWM